MSWLLKLYNKFACDKETGPPSETLQAFLKKCSFTLWKTCLGYTTFLFFSALYLTVKNLKANKPSEPWAERAWSLEIEILEKEIPEDNFKLNKKQGALEILKQIDCGC